MKKFFLIPLLTLMCSVMAWADSTPVAQVGDKVYNYVPGLQTAAYPNYKSVYSAFKAAVNEAAEGQTVEVLVDVPAHATPANNEFTISKSITIKGNNHEVARRFVVEANKTLTLTGGIIVANNYAGGSDKSTILLKNGSNLVLSNAMLQPKIDASPAVRTTSGAVATLQLVEGTENTIDAKDVHCFYAAISSGKGSLTIEGNGVLNAVQSGTKSNVFSANTSTSGKYYLNAANAHFTARSAASLFYVKADNTSVKAYAEITAGYFNYIPTKDFIVEGYVVLPQNDVNKVIELNASTALANGIVAVMDGVAYTSLSAALAAAESGSTVTLWANAAAVSVNKSLVLEANGYDASAISAASGFARAAIDGGYAFGKVNKEGNVYTVSTFDEFLFAANYAAGNGDIVRFANDIAYTKNGKGLIDITKNLTIDGQGHTFSGYGKLSASAYPAIGVNIASQSNETELTLKDITISNPCKIAAYYCRVIQTGGHVKSLTLDNVNIVAPNGNSSNARGIQVGGDDTGWDKKTVINITNSAFDMGYSSYCITSFNPYELNADHSSFDAWNVTVMKDASESAGSRGSVLNFDACDIQTINPHSGYSNDFEIFSIQDDGITINLNNCTTNAVQLGDQTQAVFDLNPWQLDHTRRVQPVVITISGDNSNIQGILSRNYWAQGFNSNKTPEQSDDYLPDPAFTYTITITGGTYGFNPASYPEVVIPSGYELKQIETQQGDQTTTLYRVRKTITTSNSINDNVENQGAGQNEHTEFLIKANETVEQPSTVANYVEVSNNATLTVPSGKELEVTNGLDVTGGAKLVVEAGSTIVVGEGGVTSENTESIVIEANENGSASFLLDPEVIINTTPNLTVKMTVKGKGYKNETSGKTYYWQRFAAPVVMAKKWSKAPDYGTWLYGWNYTAEGGKGAWAELASSEDMVPFQGYTLSPEHLVASEDEEIVYSFEGQLAGNQNMNLQFNARGFNFFGNSYTGYISVLTLVEQLMGNENIDGTVYMWNNGEQGYEPVSLQDLKENPTHYLDWQKEIAPMQTFILRQVNTGEAVSTLLNYENSIWNNPRYGNVPAPAPAPKRAAADADPFVRVMITAANGQNSQMSFAENADRSDDFEKGYDALKYMNENSINLYSSLDGQDYANVATNDLEGKTLTLQTNDEIAYTMSFPIVEGEKYAIRDNATGAVVAIEQGATYEFAAQPNSTVEGRFEIVNRYEVVTALENTEVKANAKGIYSITGQYLGEDFNALPSGVYVVNGVKIVK